jgi:xanthine/uracil permease
MVSLTLVALAVGTLLQPFAWGPVGSGYLCQPIASVLSRLRSMFPPETAGLVVLLAGIATGIVGLRTAVGSADASGSAHPIAMALALMTLAIMVALNVWGRGMLRFFCVLARRTLVIGLAPIFGLAVAMFPGLLDAFPSGARVALGTSPVLGALVALILNALFRVGVRKTFTVTVGPGPVDSTELRQ